MISVDNIAIPRVWVVVTHGHRIDSIWTSELPSRDRANALKVMCGDNPDWNVEVFAVRTNEVLR